MSIEIGKTTNTSETSLEQSRVIVGIIPGKSLTLVVYSICRNKYEYKALVKNLLKAE
jgi:hypothetical protein